MFRALLVAVGIFATVCAAIRGQPTPPPDIILPSLEVTGTRLGRPLQDSPINSTVITREALLASGRARLGELLRELPEFGGNPVAETVAFNESRGVSAFDLRGVGIGTTLILVNGRRTTANANAFEFIRTYVDLNRFSPSLIERIEILKSGASAVYGADAVGGVVNILTRRQPGGGELAFSYGNTFRNDAAELSANLVTGATRGPLALTVGFDYFQRNAQANVDRSFSRSADHTSRFVKAYDFYAGLSPGELAGFDGRQLVSGNAIVAAAPGQINGSNGVLLPGISLGAPITTLPGTNGLATGTPDFATPFRGTTGGSYHAAGTVTFVRPELTRGDPNARNLYDWNRDIWTLPEANRVNASVSLDYEGAGFLLFSELTGGRNRSRTEYHPRPYGGVVPRTNAYNPFGVDVVVDWRIPDQERRRSITEDDYASALVGSRSTPRAAFKWETAASYSRDEYVDTTRGLYLASAVHSALASHDPATALNPFGGRDYRQPAPVIAAIATEAWFGGTADLLVFDAQASGKLLHLPGGALQAAFFVEHRRERFSSVSDAASRAGDIMGTGRTGADISSARSINALAAEFAAPLLGPAQGNGSPPLIALEGAARIENFSGSFNSGLTPSVGVVARPSPGIVLRASAARTFRAPSLPQLFSPQSDTYYNSVPDPRRPVALTRDDNDGPNIPRLVRTGGNPDLDAETGRVFQAGIVWTPSARTGTSFEATWFRYGLENLISGVSPVYILENEFGGLGHLVHRAAGNQTFVNQTDAPISVLTGPAGETTKVAPGQSATVSGRLNRIDVFTVNLSRRRLVGWDFAARHEGSFMNGRTLAAAGASYADEMSSAYDAHTAAIDYAGFTSLPRWRGRVSLDWERKRWSVGSTLSYIARSGHHDANSRYQKPYRVVHLRAAYQAAAASWLRGLHFALGIDDIFNEEPPLHLDHPIGFNYRNVSRPQGRFWRATVRRIW